MDLNIWLNSTATGTQGQSTDMRTSKGVLELRSGKAIPKLKIHVPIRYKVIELVKRPRFIPRKTAITRAN